MSHATSSLEPPFNVSAVLLAAGESRRFGTDNKLLADIDGQPMVARMATLLLASSVSEIVAVLAPGAEGDDVARALGDLPLRCVRNADAAKGMGSSIACGVTALSDPHTGLMIVPSDMPALDAKLLGDLLAAYRTTRGVCIVHPVSATGEQRNPVIWPPELRHELLRLDAAQGGKAALSIYRERVVTIPARHDDIFQDIDTPTDLQRYRTGASD